MKRWKRRTSFLFFLLPLFFSALSLSLWNGPCSWPSTHTHTIAVGNSNGHRRVQLPLVRSNISNANACFAVSAVPFRLHSFQCCSCSFNFRNLSRYPTLSHLRRGMKWQTPIFQWQQAKWVPLLSDRQCPSHCQSVWWSRKASTQRGRRRRKGWLQTSVTEAVRGRRLTSQSVSQTTKANDRTSWECWRWWWWWWLSCLSCMSAIELDSVFASKKVAAATLQLAAQCGRNDSSSAKQSCTPHLSLFGVTSRELNPFPPPFYSFDL